MTHCLHIWHGGYSWLVDDPYWFWGHQVKVTGAFTSKTLFFRDSVFIYFMITSVLFVPCGGCKTYPVHLINDVIFSILEDRSARRYCCACGIFSFNFSAFSSWVVRFGLSLGILYLSIKWVTGSDGGCFHLTPPFLVDLVIHILNEIKRLLFFVTSYICNLLLTYE
jgi:hypothetical protein